MPTLFVLLSCNSGDEPSPVIDENFDAVEVIAVAVTGEEGAYSFNVTIASDDTGCDQYANWWEVIDESGELIYRRILGHSHVDEQPFTRSGGPVDIRPDQSIYVRGHMNNTGYSNSVMKGTVEAGFIKETVYEEFAKDLAELAPQPGDCPF